MSSAADSDNQAEVRRLFRHWAELEVEGDLEAWLDLVADDAVLQPPGEPPVEGKENIREYAAEFFSLPIVEMTPQSQTVHVSESGDLGCIYGDLLMALADENGRTEHQLKSLAVWKKVGGEWKLAVNSWSSNAGAEG